MAKREGTTVRFRVILYPDAPGETVHDVDAIDTVDAIRQALKAAGLYTGERMKIPSCRAWPLTCEAINVVPGEHGEGEEVPCTKPATCTVEGVAACDDCATFLRDP